MVESDEEQLELIKKWWDENGTSLVTAVVLALGVTFGYRAWEDNVRETAEAASAKYENLVQAAAVAVDVDIIGQDVDHRGGVFHDVLGLLAFEDLFVFNGFSRFNGLRVAESVFEVRVLACIDC